MKKSENVTRSESIRSPQSFCPAAESRESMASEMDTLRKIWGKAQFAAR